MCNEFRRIGKRVVVAYLSRYPDRRELHKTSVGIAGVSVDIRNVHQPHIAGAYNVPVKPLMVFF